MLFRGQNRLIWCTRWLKAHFDSFISQRHTQNPPVNGKAAKGAKGAKGRLALFPESRSFYKFWGLWMRSPRGSLWGHWDKNVYKCALRRLEQIYGTACLAKRSLAYRVARPRARCDYVPQMAIAERVLSPTLLRDAVIAGFSQTCQQRQASGWKNEIKPIKSSSSEVKAAATATEIYTVKPC